MTQNQKRPMTSESVIDVARPQPAYQPRAVQRGVSQAVTQGSRHPQMLQTKQKAHRREHTSQGMLSRHYCCSVNASANSMRKKKPMGQRRVLTHRDAKIFSKILSARVPQHMTETTHHGQRGFSLGMQGPADPSVRHTTLKDMETRGRLNNWRERILPKSKRYNKSWTKDGLKEQYST